MKKVANAARWVLAGLLLLAGLGYFVPSSVVSPLTGILYILAAVLIAPIPAVADILASANIRGAVRVGAVLIALVAGTAFIPGDKTDTPDRAVSDAETQAAAPETLPEPETVSEPEEAAEMEPETESMPETAAASIPGLQTVAELEAAAKAEEERLAAEAAAKAEEGRLAAEAAKEAEAETETEKSAELEAETQLSVDTCVELFKISLASSYGENYAVERNDNIVVIYVWGENVTLGAFAAKGGNQEALDAWNVMLNSLKNLSLTYEGILKDNGHDDMRVAIAVKNDLNFENVIASILSGVVILDIVNDIEVG